jgi:hypothetical protein
MDGGQKIRFNSAVSEKSRQFAINEGRIVEMRASDPKKLQPGSYTYAITSDPPRLIVGKVEDSFEYGVKHAHILNGRKAWSAGELRVNADGSYVFNNDSGTIVNLGLLDKGVSPNQLRKKTEESLKIYLQRSGRWSDSELVGGNSPTRQRLLEYCNQTIFCVENASSCMRVFGNSVCRN